MIYEAGGLWWCDGCAKWQTEHSAECRCGRIKVGGRLTGSLNWNPDCPVHPWNERLQAQADRSVERQRLAREARRARARRGRYNDD